MPDQRRLNEQLLRLAPEAGLPLVVTNDLHYVREDQSEAHDVLLCVGTGNNLDTPNRMKFDTHDFYVKSAAQMAALFPDHPEAIAQHPADRRDDRPIAAARPAAHPAFPGARTASPTETWLRAECQRGLERRYGTVTPELQARLDYELGVILSMGYAGYFLIVADFIAFAREQGIQTTCRGSAPGSIVTYTLGITPVDPILYQLPVRALPQPGPGDDARHRRRLRGRPARGGHRLRRAQVRPGPRRPDHHLRHDAGPGRDPRRRPGAGPLLRRGRPDRQGRPEPARHPARRGDRDLAPSCAAWSRATRRSSASPTSRATSRASPATPRPTPPASSSAASR